MKRQIESSLSIEDIVKNIDEKKILLPEFQRDFKWPLEKTEILFDSIFQNLFIGSLIIAEPKFDLACKSIDLRMRGSKKHRPKEQLKTKTQFENEEVKCLLDGQQRVTSIYRALKGPDHIYIVFEDIQKLKSNDWYDPQEKIPKVLPEDYILSFHSHKDESHLPKTDNFYILIKDLYDHIQKESREAVFFNNCVDPVIESSGCQMSLEEIEIIKDYALNLKTYFSTEVIKQSNLLSVQLLDMSLEKFCLYFERSNSQGLNLSFIDIITAKVYTKYKLQSSIKETKSKYKHFFDEKLVEPIVRYLNFIENNEVTRKSILEDLTADAFINNWEQTALDLEKVVNWLIENNLVLQISKLPYRTMLLPLVSFVQNLPSKTFNQASPLQLKQLKLWYFASLLDNRYGGAKHGSTNVVFKEDLIILRDLAKGQKIKSSYWDKLNINYSFDELKGLDSNSSAKFLGIQYLLYSNSQFLHFENNTPVSFTEAVDIHHFYPSNYLETEFGKDSDEYDVSDTILNKVYINKIANVKYKDKKPSKYLNEVKSLKSNPEIHRSLSSHLIPHPKDIIAGKHDLFFLNFLQERYNLIEPYFKNLSKELESLKTQSK
jgi:hypothetical protein